jgi:hypothetical protein
MLLKLLIFLVSVCKPYCTITFLIFNNKKLRNTSHFVKKLNFSSFPFPTTLAPFDCTLKNPTTVRILILDIRFLWYCTQALQLFGCGTTNVAQQRNIFGLLLLWSVQRYQNLPAKKGRIKVKLFSK